MKHARQTIREAAATALSGITTATIYTSRVYPMISLPVISIFANQETSESENELIGSPQRYSRRLILQVEVACEAVSGVDDDVDDFAAQIEAAMASDLTLGGSCTDSTLRSTAIDLDGNSETPIALARIQYEVWYRTTAEDAETAI